MNEDIIRFATAIRDSFDVSWDPSTPEGLHGLLCLLLHQPDGLLQDFSADVMRDYALRRRQEADQAAR